VPFVSADATQDAYDVVIAGTGFGALFFLHRLLRDRPRARVLLLEWGELRDTAWQIANGRHGVIDPENTYRGVPGEKPWNYTIGFGGGANCWGGQTPRLHPNDFQLRSRYGVGVDWPLSYGDLEPYYLEAERIMLVSGSNDLHIHYPRSGSYPQPPHAMSTADKMLKAAAPNMHFPNSSARLRIPVGDRAACCDSDICPFCPTGARFSVFNSLMHLFEHDNVHVATGAKVLQVETNGAVATGFLFQTDAGERRVSGELVALACNGIQSPFILLRSGFQHPALGRYLHEKQILQFEASLDGVDHFDGGQPVSGLNLSLLDGEHRREAGAALVGVVNSWRTGPYRDGLRPEFGRWRQILPLEIFVGDTPLESNGVFDEGGDTPVVRHAHRSDYAARGVARVIEKLPELLAPLPVESIRRLEDASTGSHVQGTVRMGADPDTSIVDAGLMHHQVRNLLVLGTATFPSCGTGNPTLTAAALSLRAARLLAA
jgi:choline dehydrogenase-like flavoprotein